MALRMMDGHLWTVMVWRMWPLPLTHLQTSFLVLNIIHQCFQPLEVCYVPRRQCCFRYFTSFFYGFVLYMLGLSLLLHSSSLCPMDKQSWISLFLFDSSKLDCGIPTLINFSHGSAECSPCSASPFSEGTPLRMGRLWCWCLLCCMS